MRITHDQKETALEAIKEYGTMKAGAEAAGVNVKTLNNEMNRSKVFRERVLKARTEGYNRLADNARQLVIDYADGHCAFCHGSKTMLADVCPYCKGTGLPDKTDRNRLTAAIALLNAYEPGFRGTTIIQGHIDHRLIPVKTAVPRPKYDEIKSPKVIKIEKPRNKKYLNISEDDKQTLKLLNSGEPVTAKDKE